jgi:hypothetical protein
MTARRILLAALVIAAMCSVSVGQAQARSTGPKTYGQVQGQVAFTVYAPTTTFGLKRSAFSLVDCGQEQFLNAGYGSQEDANTTWLAFNESTHVCTDGPDGIGKAATVTVKGVKAVIYGACTGGRATCPSATRASVLTTGWTEVTLPAVNRTTTYLQLYTQGLSVAQIREFLATMRAVSTRPSDPKTFAQVQAKAPFTVYVPTERFGLKRTMFLPNSCGTGNPGVTVAYGSQQGAHPTWISFSESQGYCDDGPDGVGPAGTIDVNGISVAVAGSCARLASTCDTAAPNGVVRGSYLEVVLPAVGAGRSATQVQMYTEGLTLEQIQQFLSTMPTLP